MSKEGPTNGDEARRNGSATNGNAPSQTAAARRSLMGLPWAWIGLSGLATLVWFIGIGWLAIKLFRWFTE